MLSLDFFCLADLLSPWLSATYRGARRGATLRTDVPGGACRAAGKPPPPSLGASLSLCSAVACLCRAHKEILPTARLRARWRELRGDGRPGFLTLRVFSALPLLLPPIIRCVWEFP